MTFCIMDTQCAVYDRTYRMPGYAVDSQLCMACETNTRSTLNRLRYDYIDLSQLIVPVDSRQEKEQIFRPKPESKPPIDMHAFAVRAEIAWFIAQVADAVRIWTGSMRRAAHLAVREGYRMDNDLRYLAEHTSMIAVLPARRARWLPEDEPAEMDGLALLLKLGELHRRARRMCGTDPRVMTVPGDCPDCATTSLRRHDDDAEKVWCLHCKRRFGRDEYIKIVTLQIPGDRNPTG